MRPPAGLAACLCLALLLTAGCGSRGPESAGRDDVWELRILHTNDTHAHVAGIDGRGNACLDESDCRGGLSRIAAAIDAEKRRAGNVLALDAGDQFQGTLFYTVNGWPMLADYDRRLPYDAVTLGNHEFDEGCAALRRFLEAQPLPVLAANLVPETGCPLRDSRIRPWIIREIDGRRVGIVGLANDEVRTLARACPHTRFLDRTEALRRAVAALEGRGVRHIVALSHLGLPADRELARTVDGVDVIVGGHTHSRLGPGSSEGPYPVVESSPSGRPVLVVTAGRAASHLGDLSVTFSPAGIPLRWTGEARELAATAARRRDISALTARYAARLNGYRTRMVGSHDVHMPDGMDACRKGECFSALLMADAFLDYGRRYGAQLALVNGGSVRAALPAGDISLGQLLSAMPFGNALVLREYSGKALRAALEHGVSGPDGTGPALLHPAGLRYATDVSRPAGSRILGIELIAADGTATPLRDDAICRVVLYEYLARGGDGFAMLSRGRAPASAQALDVDVVEAYLKAHWPLTNIAAGRIRRMGAEQTAGR